MKSIAIAVLMLLASANALPTLTEDELRQERFITDIIQSILDSWSQFIQDGGLDPLNVMYARGSFAVPQYNPIVGADAFVKSFNFRGLSKIFVNEISYSIISSRLVLRLSLPNIALSVGDSGFELFLFSRTLDGQGSGSLEINNVRLSVDVRVSVGVISGITIRDLSVTFLIDNVESNLFIRIGSRDLSDIVNNNLNKIPAFLQNNKAKISELLEYIILRIADEFLDFN